MEHEWYAAFTHGYTALAGYYGDLSKRDSVAREFARWATSPWVRKNLPKASLADLWAEFA